VTIADIHGSTATKTVSVEIAGRNDAPVAEALSGTVRAWGSSSFRPSDVSFAPLFDDLDRSDTHTVTTDEHGAVGMVRTHPDGTFTYDDMRRFAWLGEGETATDSFTYTVTDNHGAADTETVTVTLQGTNDDPVAQGMLAVMKAHDAPLRLTPAFTDADLHDTHRIEVPLIGRGNAAVNADGTITYDPGHAFDYLRVGESATDTFLYEVTDNHGGRASNLVTVHIRGDNFAPVIADPVQAAELKELNDTIFAHAERMAGGAIHYKDADVGDRVTASIAGQTVQAFDWAGRALALNEAQVAGIKASQAEQQVLRRGAAVFVVVRFAVAEGPVPVGRTHVRALVRLACPRTCGGERQAGRRHQPLLGAGHRDVHAPLVHLERHAAERSDRIDEQQRVAPGPVARLGDGLDVVLHARRGVDLRHEDRLDAAVRLELRLDRFGRDGAADVAREHLDLCPQHLRGFAPGDREAPAFQDQHLVAAREHVGKRGLPGAVAVRGGDVGAPRRVEDAAHVGEQSIRERNQRPRIDVDRGLLHGREHGIRDDGRARDGEEFTAGGNGHQGPQRSPIIRAKAGTQLSRGPGSPLSQG
jgi:VCBS repeat-containing protein